MAAAWDVALAKIPTDELVPVYQQAIQSHTSDAPFGAGNLLKAWEHVQFSRTFPSAFGMKDLWQQPLTCNLCGDTGWREVVTCDVQGNKNTASTKCDHKIN